jgi:uncharacterized protein YjbI with pentapeptide repeats
LCVNNKKREEEQMKKFLMILAVGFCSIAYPYNVQHVALFKKKIAKKEGNINVSQCDFRGAGDKLKGIKCPGAQLSGATFAMSKKKSVIGGIVSIPNQKTDLTGANFSNSVCVSTDFSDATLHGVNFTGADLSYANFTGADLTSAIFKNVKNVELATFCGATMPDGSGCSGGLWQNKSKSITLYCNCPKKK